MPEENKVFKWARKAKKVELEIAERKAKLEKYQDRIKREMERQQVTSLASEDGVKITYVRTERTNYSLEQLMNLLPAKEIKKVTKLVLDPGALQSEVLAGNIEADVVARSSHVSLNAPYVRISVKE